MQLLKHDLPRTYELLSSGAIDALLPAGLLALKLCFDRLERLLKYESVVEGLQACLSGSGLVLSILHHY